MLNRFSIRQRLFALLVVLCALLALLGWYGLSAIRGSNGALERVYVDHVVPLRQLKQIADAYAQQNASASEELAATAGELGGQAAQLQELMTFFRLADRGRSAATARRSAPAQRAPNPAAAPHHRAPARVTALTPAEHDFERF